MVCKAGSRSRRLRVEVENRVSRTSISEFKLGGQAKATERP
jgi:hypothetical protein